VIISTVAETDIQNIYLFGVETFGKNAPETFKAELIFMIRALKNLYEIHPECRFLMTNSRMYRNIVFGSYLIIYRITPARIEVLKAMNSRTSITGIRAARKIKI